MCDLSLNLDCHSLLDLDRHSWRGRSRLLDRICESPKEPDRAPTGQHWLRWSLQSLDSGAHNPHREPKAQPRAGGDPEQYNRTSSACGDEFR